MPKNAVLATEPKPSESEKERGERDRDQARAAKINGVRPTNRKQTQVTGPSGGDPLHPETSGATKYLDSEVAGERP